MIELPTIIKRRCERLPSGDLALVDEEENEIEIATLQPPQSYLESLIHEALHIAFPEKSDKEVENACLLIGGMLWQEGFRKRHVPKGATKLEVLLDKSFEMLSEDEQEAVLADE